MNLKTPRRLPTVPTLQDIESAAPFSTAEPITGSSSGSLIKSIAALDAETRTPIVVTPEITVESQDKTADNIANSEVNNNLTNIANILSQLRDIQDEALEIEVNDHNARYLARLSSKVSKASRLDSTNDINSTTQGESFVGPDADFPPVPEEPKKASKFRTLLDKSSSLQSNILDFTGNIEQRGNTREQQHPLLVKALRTASLGMSDKLLAAYDATKELKDRRESNTASESSDNFSEVYSEAAGKDSQKESNTSNSAKTSTNESDKKSTSSSDTSSESTNTNSTTYAETNSQPSPLDMSNVVQFRTQSDIASENRVSSASMSTGESSTVLAKLGDISLNTSKLLTSFDKLVESDISANSTLSEEDKSTVASVITGDSSNSSSISSISAGSSINSLTTELVKATEVDSNSSTDASKVVDISKFSTSELSRDIAVQINSSMDNLKTSLSHMDASLDKNAMFLNQLSVQSRKSNVTADHMLDKMTAVVANTDNLENILDMQRQIAEDSERAANEAADANGFGLTDILELAGITGGAAGLLGFAKDKLGFGKDKSNPDGKDTKPKKATDVPNKKANADMPKVKGKGAFGLITRGIAALGGGYLINNLLGGAEDATGDMTPEQRIEAQAEAQRNQAKAGFGVNVAIDAATIAAQKHASKQAAQSTAKAGVQASAKAMATKAAGEVSEEAAEKVGAKVAAKTGAKFFLKKLPVLGLGIGMFDAVSEALDGNWGRAAASLASGVASTVPGVGTAVSTVIDAGLLADTLNDVDKAEVDAKAKLTPAVTAKLNANKILNEAGVSAETDINNIAQATDTTVNAERAMPISEPVASLEVNRLAQATENNNSVSEEVTASVSQALASVSKSQANTKSKTTSTTPIIKGGFEISDPGVQAMGIASQYV